MENTPTLTTPRLTLRRFTPDDAAAYFKLMSDQTVNTFLPLFPLQTLEEAAAHLKENYLNSYREPVGFRYAICQKADDIPIGYVIYSHSGSRDFGYALRKEFWNQGIVTEAAQAVIGQLIKSGIPFITATHDVQNPRSGRVMQKLGMTYRYSYREQWQPKDFPVVFRMYQRDLNHKRHPVYKGYWNKYPEHFIEDGV